MKLIVSLAAGVALVLASAVGAAALAQGGGVAEIEAKMTEYIGIWNTHDASQVLAKIYRMPDTALGTPAGLQKNFDDLKAQGYDHSQLFGVRGCLLTPETGLGEMDFTRLKTDGSVLQARRTSVYQLKKFPDGWRITSFGAGPTNCFAPAPAAGAPAKAN